MKTDTFVVASGEILLVVASGEILGVGASVRCNSKSGCYFRGVLFGFEIA